MSIACNSYALLNFSPIENFCSTRPILNSTNPDPCQKCVFPFEHKGKTYKECIKTKKGDDFWCATEGYNEGSGKDDKTKSNTVKENKWGLCLSLIHI